MEDNKIKIDIETDGVYITMINSSSGKKSTRQDVLNLIEASGIKDVDFSVINELFKTNDKLVRKKISSNTNITQKNETIVVDVSRDKMQAFIRFIAPTNNGSLLTVEDVEQELRKSNISFGVEPGAIEKIMSSRNYGVVYPVATGRPPVNGKDGYLNYHFDKDKKRSLKPKELESGKVDFHSLDLIETGDVGQLLVTAVQPIAGTDGFNVYGTQLPHKKGKLTPPLPKGKNVYISPDGSQLLAEVSGQILYANNKVSIWPVLEIKGNVDNTTGNIDFNGSVIIAGSVLSGFSVTATEDISIAGVVEGSTIQAGGNLLSSSGVQGGNKAFITAGKDITTKFIESAHVIAGGNIISDSILHSIVKCDGSLELVGRKGLIVGGKISVGETIKAQTIGSSWATATELEVGIHLEKLELYNESIQKMKKLEADLKVLDGLFDVLYAAHQKQQLSDEKKNALVKTLHSKKFLKQQIQALEAQITELLPYIDTKRGSISVSQVIRHGVKVSIGNASLHIRDDIQNCKLVNTDGRVTITPYV